MTYDIKYFFEMEVVVFFDVTLSVAKSLIVESTNRLTLRYAQGDVVCYLTSTR